MTRRRRGGGGHLQRDAAEVDDDLLREVALAVRLERLEQRRLGKGGDGTERIAGDT